MQKNSAKLYFGKGKGIKNISKMLEKIKSSSSNEKTFFCIKMFKKRLRGSLTSINLREEACFGDFTISFQWKDYLKGKIIHPMDDCQYIFDNNFTCLVEM